ncbi:MAG TPA: hypothetical protein VF595_16105 [Tepidisphaeraceae bacterium]
MSMKPFSSSDLGHLQGKPRDVVELVFCELRDAADAADRLFVQPPTIWSHVRHARRLLAGKGIRLPDRRFAMPTGQAYSDVN